MVNVGKYTGPMYPVAFFFVTWLFREYGKVSRENSKIRKILKMQKTHENSKIQKFEKFKAKNARKLENSKISKNEKNARKLENSKIEKIQQQVSEGV